MLRLQDLSEHLDTTGRFNLIHLGRREVGMNDLRPLDGGGVGGHIN